MSRPTVLQRVQLTGDDQHANLRLAVAEQLGHLSDRVPLRWQRHRLRHGYVPPASSAGWRVRASADRAEWGLRPGRQGPGYARLAARVFPAVRPRRLPKGHDTKPPAGGWATLHKPTLVLMAGTARPRRKDRTDG